MKGGRMKVAVAIKVVPDDQDIQIAADGSLDFSRAHQTISVYDLNAIEAAVQLASSVGDSSVTAVTVGGPKIDDSKLKKNILARGVDNLVMALGDSAANLDAHATAAALVSLVERSGGFDIVICGDGSADNYARQVDVQLGCALGWPSVSGVVSIESKGSAFLLKRVLEDEVETVEVEAPAVVSVLPDIALPRIPGMKDILAAGKKPMDVSSLDTVAAPSIGIVSVKAPEQTARALDIIDSFEDGAIEKFAAALKAAL